MKTKRRSGPVHAAMFVCLALLFTFAPVSSAAAVTEADAASTIDAPTPGENGTGGENVDVRAEPASALAAELIAMTALSGGAAASAFVGGAVLAGGGIGADLSLASGENFLPYVLFAAGIVGAVMLPAAGVLVAAVLFKVRWTRTLPAALGAMVVAPLGMLLGGGLGWLVSGPVFGEPPGEGGLLSLERSSAESARIVSAVAGAATTGAAFGAAGAAAGFGVGWGVDALIVDAE